MTEPGAGRSGPGAGGLQPPGTLSALAFLTTGCTPCQPVWDALAAGVADRCPSFAVVVVTPSRSMQDEQEARRRTPRGVLLHMSSSTWFAYGVGQAGTLLLVRAAEGDAAAWVEPGTELARALPKTATEVRELFEQWQDRAVGCP